MPRRIEDQALVVLGLREDAGPGVEKGGGIVHGTGNGLYDMVNADYYDCSGRILTYIHVAPGMLQTVYHALDDLVDVPDSGQFFA